MCLNKLALCSRSRNFLPYKGIKVQYGTNNSLPLDSVLLKLMQSVPSDHTCSKIRVARSVTVLCIGANMVGPCSVGGIAIRYGLDGPGIELRWGRDFLQPSRPALGSTQPPVPCLCPGGKATGAWP